MRRFSRNGAAAFAAAALTLTATACGGSSTAPAPTPTPIPMVYYPVHVTDHDTVTVGTQPNEAMLFASNLLFENIQYPANVLGTATIQLLISTTEPTGLPSLASAVRRPAVIEVPGLVPLAFTSSVASANLYFATAPLFEYGLQGPLTSALASTAYLAEYDPTHAAAGWLIIAGPGTITTDFLTFPAGPGAISQIAGQTYVYALLVAGP